MIIVISIILIAAVVTILMRPRTAICCFCEKEKDRSDMVVVSEKEGKYACEECYHFFVDQH